ncbi:MAG: uroporphyrinogen decarboxylase family protein [Anaerolineae bacterium]
MTEMTSRERVLTAARRQGPDRVPRTMPIERRVRDTLIDHFGTDDLFSAMRMDIAGISPNPTTREGDFAPYFPHPDVTWDEWGRGRVWDETMHYAEYLYPLSRAETADEIRAYPWPDLMAPYRYAGLPERVAAHHAQGLAVSGHLGESAFEIAWQLRSMERLLEDMMLDDEKAVLILNAITDRRVVTARAYATAGVDILATGDDVAMQNGLMMSRPFWRRWLQPRLRRIIEAARAVNPDILVWYHSDGKINDLVSDLIATGVDILNPVQPECVDHRWIKATYGDRLAFSGGLGVQSVLPFGTPEEVRAHVKATIEALGAGGGLIVGPSHVIERDTSLENILAMLDAIDAYGVYG